MYSVHQGTSVHATDVKIAIKFCVLGLVLYPFIVILEEGRVSGGEHIRVVDLE